MYLRDMLSFCELVLEFTHGVERDAFFSDRMRRDATLRNLELIGEAATRVPDAIRALAPDVPWRAYLGIEGDAVWAIVSADVPTLRRSLQALLASV